MIRACNMSMFAWMLLFSLTLDPIDILFLVYSNVCTNEIIFKVSKRKLIDF